MRPGRWRCLGVVGATLPLWIPASARMTNSVAEDNYFRTNRPCRLRPAHQSMKSRSCGLVPVIGTVDSATPHLDPSGGQAPALHFPLPTHGPLSCIGVLERVSRLVQAEAWPGRRACHSRPHPGRFANRPYGDDCIWWDAGLGGFLGREQDDRADRERARPDVDEAGVLDQPG